MSVSVATFSSNNQFMAAYWQIVFHNKKFATNILLKRKCFLLVIFFQKNITAHDAPKNMHPRYSQRAALFAPITFVQKHGLVLYISGLEESSFTVLE
jgi:hypothetical protein